MSRWLGIAGLVVTIGCGQASPQPQSSAPAERPRFDPLKYEPPATRENKAGRQEFDAAMALYAKGDYRGAIGGFRRVIDLDLTANDARLFLGVSLLLTGDAAGGISELEGLMAVGPAPYIEEAYFYLARGRLMAGDAKRAREHLEWLIEFGGKYQAQAKELLSQIR